MIGLRIMVFIGLVCMVFLGILSIVGIVETISKIANKGKDVGFTFILTVIFLALIFGCFKSSECMSQDIDDFKYQGETSAEVVNVEKFRR